MNTRRSRLFLLAGVSGATLSLAACASTTSGSGSTSGSSSSPAAAKAPTDAAGLTALMRSALSSATSVHIALSGSTNGSAMTGNGDETFAGGKLLAAQITENLGATGAFQIRVVDGRFYLNPPTSLSLTTTAKPWLLATTTSTDPVIKQLAGLVTTVQSAGSLNKYSDLAQYASSVKLVGAEDVNGVKANHYAIVIDPAKLPADFPERAEVVASGVTSLPYDLWIDGSGRMLKVLTSTTVKSVTVSTTTLFTNYNAKVTITAPPASQVTTK